MTEPNAEHLIKTRQLILAELTRRNIPADLITEGSVQLISIGDGRSFSVNALAEHLMQVHPEDHEKVMAEQVEAMLLSFGQPNLGDLSEEQLLAQVRTRLIHAKEGFSYGRAFGEELIQVLCIDYPETLMLLDDEAIKGLPVPVDILFEAGQANTDAEEIGGVGQIDGGIYLIEAEHPYMAAKAGNIMGLMESVLGLRPAGVVFALLSRNALLFAIPQPPSPLDAVIGVAQTMIGVLNSPSFNPPGGILSGLTYFYSEESGLETFARSSMMDGQPSMVVTPSETFDRLYGD